MIPVKGVIPLAHMAGDDEEDTRLLGIMAEGAQNYLRCFSWCKRILDAYFGDGYGGVVAVFLLHIEPARPGIDDWLWVIFGDVPPAYLVTDSAKTPSEALERYLDGIAEWIELARQGRSSKDVIPVYVPATPENAADVERRMKILREVVVPAFQESEAVRG